MTTIRCYPPSFTKVSAWLAFVLAAACLVLGVGCGSSSPGFQYGAPDSTVYIPPEGKALMVVIRKSGSYSRRTTRIVDEHGVFVASLVGGTHSVVPIDAGRHSYFSITRGRGVPWVVNAEANHVYVITADVYGDDHGGIRFVPRPLRAQGEGAQERFDLLLRQTALTTPDREAGEDWTRENRDTVGEEMQEGMATWQAMDAASRSAYSLNPEDGFVSFARRAAAERMGSEAGFQLQP